MSGGQPVTVAMHDAPIKEIAWIPEMNVLVTGSWDKILKYEVILLFICMHGIGVFHHNLLHFNCQFN